MISRKTFEDLMVTLCGMITSHLTVILVFLVSHYLHFEIITLGAWGGILPIGAILCGFVAASGYYFSSVYFKHPPSHFLMISMALISLETQILIYVVQYHTARFQFSMKASDMMTFWEYLQWTLTHATFVKPGSDLRGAQVGWFGYVLAVIELIGFMIGGLSIYVRLEEKFKKSNPVMKVE